VEVYVVTSQQLRRIDRLEGHPSFYHREPVALDDSLLLPGLTVEGQRSLRVEAYVGPQVEKYHGVYLGARWPLTEEDAVA
jgi:hypothetical protein